MPVSLEDRAIADIAGDDAHQTTAHSNPHGACGIRQRSCQILSSSIVGVCEREVRDGAPIPPREAEGSQASRCAESDQGSGADQTQASGSPHSGVHTFLRIA
jgi:hypothetical protein